MDDCPGGMAPAGANGGLPALRTGRAYGAETVAEARRLIETTDLSLQEIALRIDVSSSTLSIWRRRGDWARPGLAPMAPTLGRADASPAGRAADRKRKMLDRLYRVFSRQLSDIEARLREEGAVADAKDARLLATLARTLGTLTALERDDGAEAHQPEPIDLDELRARIARRLADFEE